MAERGSPRRKGRARCVAMQLSVEMAPTRRSAILLKKSSHPGVIPVRGDSADSFDSEETSFFRSIGCSGTPGSRRAENRAENRAGRNIEKVFYRKIQRAQRKIREGCLITGNQKDIERDGNRERERDGDIARQVDCHATVFTASSVTRR